MNVEQSIERIKDNFEKHEIADNARFLSIEEKLDLLLKNDKELMEAWRNVTVGKKLVIGFLTFVGALVATIAGIVKLIQFLNK